MITYMYYLFHLKVIRNPLEFVMLPTCGFIQSLVGDITQLLSCRHGYESHQSLNFFSFLCL